MVPDFIYLDGPDLDKLAGNTNEINLSKNKNFTPMSCDILKIENSVASRESYGGTGFNEIEKQIKIAKVNLAKK